MKDAEDHPALLFRHPVERWSRAWRIAVGDPRSLRRHFKKRAAKAARRAARQILRGDRPRWRKRSGDTWQVA